MPSDKNLNRAMLWSTEGLERPLECDHGVYLRFELQFMSQEYTEWTASTVTTTALNEYSRLGGLLRTMIDDAALRCDREPRGHRAAAA
ncbi:MAG: hypothetical protein ACNA8P_06740 [Phycisphaerales bacterium]